MARNAANRNQPLPVFGLDTAVRFATPADRAAFAGELTTAITQLVSKYHDERAKDGRWQRLTLAVHPVPKGVDPGAPHEPSTSPPGGAGDDTRPNEQPTEEKRR